jgi:hypothetical protein
LASFLADRLSSGPKRVIVEPFVFTGKSKSDPGWAFVGLIDGGPIKEYADDGADITRIYRHQLAACTYEVLPGPGKLLRWSAPPSRGHDDLLVSTAMTARLDAMDWRDRTARGTGPWWRRALADPRRSPGQASPTMSRMFVSSASRSNGLSR